jgi:hypothetical protein
MRFTSSFFSWAASCDWRRVRWFLVVPFPASGPPPSFFGLFDCLDFWSLPLVSFSLPCLGAFFFIKFGRVSSIWMLVSYCRRYVCIFSKTKKKDVEIINNFWNPKELPYDIEIVKKITKMALLCELGTRPVCVCVSLSHK